MLNDIKDQEIIVDSPLPRESMGQSSGSTPTLPYSHGQNVLSIPTSSPSTIPATSSPMSVPQNVTIEHFPLVSSFQTLITILHCNLLQYLFLILPLILILFYLLHWVPLYMATPFLLFILIQPLYLVLTP